MRRVYLLVPDTNIAKAIVTELAQKMHIPQRHMHALGNLSTPLGDLPEANLLQKSDVKFGIEMGASFGGVAGLWGALLAILYPPGGALEFPPELILIVGSLVGMVFGTIVSAMIAQGMPNHELQVFDAAIAKGQVLLILDIPQKQLDEAVRLLHRHYPHADIRVMLAQ